MDRKLFAIALVTIAIASLTFWGCSKDSPTDIDTVPTLTIEMITIPAGNFSMGSTASDTVRWPGTSREYPQHTVYLDAYQISKYEITNAQYKIFMDAGGYSDSTYWTAEGWAYRISGNRTEPYIWTSGYYNNGIAYPNHPVVVTWYEAYAFCRWAGGHLPTEAQWEKAARGNVTANYWPWGSVWYSAKCNSCYDIWPDTFVYSSPVGSFSAGKSLYGVHDMAGNLWEWVNDKYQSDYYSVSPSSNPPGPDTGSDRVFRGGSWDNGDPSCRTTNRNKLFPSASTHNIGFRLAN